jgi:hypothetical protein
VIINDYYVNSYWWLFRCKPLVVIDGYFIMVINRYCIISYFGYYMLYYNYW